MSAEDFAEKRMRIVALAHRLSLVEHAMKMLPDMVGHDADAVGASRNFVRQDRLHEHPAATPSRLLDYHGVVWKM
jgi:hypothetical protein